MKLPSQRHLFDTPDDLALLPAAEVAIRQILEWGVDNVCETVTALADAIVERGGRWG